MKPAVSLKDNEEKQIQLLRKYVAPAVLKNCRRILRTDIGDIAEKHTTKCMNFEEEQFCTGDKKLSENGKTVIESFSCEIRII